jgi:hypothetical protein
VVAGAAKLGCGTFQRRLATVANVNSGTVRRTGPLTGPSQEGNVTADAPTRHQAYGAIRNATGEATVRVSGDSIFICCTAPTTAARGYGLYLHLAGC